MASWWSRNRQLILQSAGTLLAIALLLLLLKEERKEGGEILAAMRAIKPVDLLWVALLFAISRIAVAGAGTSFCCPVGSPSASGTAWR
jgi:GAF domain-containing protein